MRSLKTLALAASLIATFGTQRLAAQGPDAERHQITGQITVINHFTGQVTIRTQELPGLEGKSMTVAYLPKDSTALKELHEGDHVKGDLVVGGNDTHMENVTAIGTTQVEPTKGAKKDSTPPERS